MYFYGSKLASSGPRDLGPLNIHLNKLGKGPLANATYQVEASEPSGSEEEDF